MEIIIALLAGAAVSGGIIYTVIKPKFDNQEAEIERQNHERVEKSKMRAKEILLEAEKRALQMSERASKIVDKSAEEQKELRFKLEKIEERLTLKEENIDKKQSDFEKKLDEVREKEMKIQKMAADLDEMKGKEMKKLEEVAKLNQDEAREELLKRVETIVQSDIKQRIASEEKKANEIASEKAKNIIAQAIQKYAAEVASDSTTTVVTLPSDDMKGRVIGKEGRNINAFEQLTGIDVIVDDTPNSIIISGFDLLRRYVAKLTLEKLVEDGRIHPARIEETLEKVKESRRK